MEPGKQALRDEIVPVELFAFLGGIRLAADLAGKKIGTAALSVGSNSLLIVLKLVVGFVTGSVSVISEAIHSAVDLVAAVIALFAVRASGRAADEKHPYGHGKYENISGTVEAVLIFIAAAWIIFEAVRKLIEGPGKDKVTIGWGVAVMFVSAVVNILVSRRLFKVGKATDSMALQADAWHLRTDVYTSLGVMFGLVIILSVKLFSGHSLWWLDPVIAILVALMIVRAAWRLTRESARDLLDVSLPEEDVNWLHDFVCATWPQVRSFHKLRTRKAGSTRFLDFHVAVEDKMSVGEAHALGDEIVNALHERYPDSRVQIHIEPCDYTCPESCEEGCSLSVEQRRKRES